MQSLHKTALYIDLDKFDNEKLRCNLHKVIITLLTT
jgi:hypothetical protein